MSSKIIKMKKTYQVVVMKAKICLILKINTLLTNKLMMNWIKLRSLTIYLIFLNLKTKIIVMNKDMMVYIGINLIAVELGVPKLWIINSWLVS